MRVVYPSNRYLAPRVRLFLDALIGGYASSIDRMKVLDGAPDAARSRARRNARHGTSEARHDSCARGPAASRRHRRSQSFDRDELSDKVDEDPAFASCSAMTVSMTE